MRIKRLFLRGIMVFVISLFLGQINVAGVELDKEEGNKDKKGFEDLLKRPDIQGRVLVRENAEGLELTKDAKEPESPQYVPGEVIVKFKKGVTDIPAGIQALNKKYKLKKIEKVFKDKPQAQSPELKAHLEQRQKRAPKDGLEKAKALKEGFQRIYRLTFDKEADIEAIIQDYKNNPDVEYIEPNYIFKTQSFPETLPNDTYVNPSGDGFTWLRGSWGQSYEDMWGLKKIEAYKAWPISQGEGIVVAVVDTGLDYNHPDIRDNVWVNPAVVIDRNGDGKINLDDCDLNGNHRIETDEIIDHMFGWDFVSYNYLLPQEDNDPKDGHGHGTHVAGTIAATGDNNLGIIGVAPKARIMAVKGLDDSNGSGDTVDLARCLRYAADYGADVINNSWGGSGNSITLEEAVNYAYAQGCAVIAAAGNSSGNAANFHPANIKSVITVSASDETDHICQFSNFGVKVDVSAPGGTSNILSLLAADSFYQQYYQSYIVGTNYIRLQGTSMASPHVAGVVALLLQKSPGLDVEEIRSILRASADYVYAQPAGAPYGYPYTFPGYGRLNAYRALQIENPCIANIETPKINGLLKTGILPIRGTASGSDFQSYRLDYTITLNDNPAWLPIVSSVTSPVTNGSLGECTMNNSASVYLRLTVTDKNNRNFVAINGPVIVEEKLHPGWPRYISSVASRHTPFAIADVDNDGKEEIIISDRGGKVYIFKEDGSYLDGWPQAAGTSVISDISCADIDNDGDMEIFFAGYNQNIYAYHADGTPVRGWPQTIAEDIKSGFYSIAIGDVNNDSNLEIIIVPSAGGRVTDAYTYIFKGDGSLLAKWFLCDSWTVNEVLYRSGSVIGDINKDGNLEIVVPMVDLQDSYYYLYVFDYQGNILKKLKLEGVKANIQRGSWWLLIDLVGGSARRPVLGDLDRDGDLEIIFSGQARNAQGYYPSKLFIWSYDNGNYTNTVTQDLFINEAALALADVDNNKNLEVICAGPNTNSIGQSEGRSVVGGYRYDGSFLFRTNPSDTRNSYFFGAPVIGNIDTDTGKEILVCDSFANMTNESLKLYAFNHDGSKNAVFKIPGGSSIWDNLVSPALADLNNDGFAEIVAIGPDEGCIMVLDTQAPYNTSFLDWPQFQHDPQHSGNHPFRMNNYPVLTLPYSSISINEGESLQFTVTAADSDNDKLAFSRPLSAELPLGATFMDNGNGTATFSWSPDYTQGKTKPYTIHFEVFDGSLTDAKDINITVNNVSIYGNIYDKNNNPISGATIYAGKFSNNDFTGTISLMVKVNTDTAGHYIIAQDLPQGAYRLVASYPGLYNEFVQQIISFNQTYNINFTIREPPLFFGIVMNNYGQRLPGVSIALKNVSTGVLLPGYSKITNSMGILNVYPEDNVPIGIYNVVCAKEGYFQTTYSQNTKVTIPGNYAIIGMTEVINNPATLTGYVKDASGNPISSAGINLRRLSTGHRYATSTTPTGYFSFGSNMPPGAYLFNVTKANYNSLTQTTYLKPDEIKEITLTLTPSCVVSGKVTDTSGDAVYGVKVELLMQDGVALKTYNISYSGKNYSFNQDIPMLTYKLRVSAPGYQTQEQTINFTMQGEKKVVDFRLVK